MRLRPLLLARPHSVSCNKIPNHLIFLTRLKIFVFVCARAEIKGIIIVCIGLLLGGRAIIDSNCDQPRTVLHTCPNGTDRGTFLWIRISYDPSAPVGANYKLQMPGRGCGSCVKREFESFNNGETKKKLKEPVARQDDDCNCTSCPEDDRGGVSNW